MNYTKTIKETELIPTFIHICHKETNIKRMTASEKIQLVADCQTIEHFLRYVKMKIEGKL